LQRVLPGSDKQSWVLPNGEVAEQAGERQTDLVLVWAEAEGEALTEERMRSRWPQGKRFQKIGQNLFLVSGVEPAKPADEPVVQVPGPPREQGEQLLAAARQAGDRRREASTLVDLSVIYLHEKEPQRAIAALEEALAIARQLGDRSRESDALGNLALTLQTDGQQQRALELLDQGLACARSAGDRFEEKTALERLGNAYATWPDPARSIGFYEEALPIARALGDRRHEAELIWQSAVQYAELGRRDEAAARAKAAIEVWQSVGHTHAGWFATHLHQYLLGEKGAGLPRLGDVTASAAGPYGGSLVVNATGQGESARGPGILRMAYTALKSMGKFLASGMKTVSPETHRKRLAECARCEHHTGLRCRICGCFTMAKTLMPHEDCPIGKWPAG
jgi:tetratricopeptide (TPR) repeat protein